eukprot:TRINITY_DN20021_c2_g1_i1.p1 TRINITY_DN20021_c2_g1~~TRINITY_DN20021_c2_g1_i1.p1  ORF type:complete len:365 (-),score=23.99 TRINITY_DN20021_c2_g1_i1:165-1151(-)
MEKVLANLAYAQRKLNRSGNHVHQTYAKDISSLVWSLSQAAKSISNRITISLNELIPEQGAGSSSLVLPSYLPCLGTLDANVIVKYTSNAIAAETQTEGCIMRADESITSSVDAPCNDAEVQTSDAVVITRDELRELLVDTSKKVAKETASNMASSVQDLKDRVNIKDTEIIVLREALNESRTKEFREALRPVVSLWSKALDVVDCLRAGRLPVSVPVHVYPEVVRALHADPMDIAYSLIEKGYVASAPYKNPLSSNGFKLSDPSQCCFWPRMSASFRPGQLQRDWCVFEVLSSQNLDEGDDSNYDEYGYSLDDWKHYDCIPEDSDDW